MARDVGAADTALVESTDTALDEETSSDSATSTDSMHADGDSVVADDDSSDELAAVRAPRSRLRLAAVVGLAALVAVSSLAGWLGFGDYQSRQAQERRELFLQVGRQGALNLTTIDWQHAEADIKRVLDSSTGSFYDDFSKRSQPFIEVVKKAQAKSVGTVTEAGVESASDKEGKVLVAVNVDTSNLGAAQQEPRYWRMRVSVEKIGNGAKVSNVEFVP